MRNIGTTRRRLMMGAAMLSLAGRAHAAAADIRLGVLQFGTVQWIADVIRRHGFDAAHGVAVQQSMLANTDAARVALLAGSADVVVSDWPFVAAQRAAGRKLCFAPFSSATGGVMVPADSPLHSLADLAGHRLGVAGGPVDKSWLLVRAAAQAGGTDLAGTARLAYGAPPLLNAKLMQGELDAVLTFYPYAARLEAAGYRQLMSVSDAAVSLGLPATLSLVGYVFHEDWADANRAAIDGFLAASDEAEKLLATDETEWTRIRPLMDAPDDALFASLRRRFLAGLSQPSAAEQQHTAEQVFAVLLRTGGEAATGGIAQLPAGIFWRRSDEAG